MKALESAWLHIQILPTGYVGFIWHSTAMATASWSTFEGIFCSYCDRSYLACSSCRVPWKYPQRFSNLLLPQYVGPLRLGASPQTSDYPRTQVQADDNYPYIGQLFFSVFYRCKQALDLLRNTELMRVCVLHTGEEVVIFSHLCC